MSVRNALASDVTDLSPLALRILVLVVSLSLFNFGYNTASIGGALLYIDSEDVSCQGEQICLRSSLERGIVVSSCLVGAIFGALFAGSLADRHGRRTTLLANNFFYIVGPIGMALAPDIYCLMVARACAGVGVGAASALVHVYISEVVPASRRGEHGAISVMMGTGGMLCANLAAYGLGANWRWVLGMSSFVAAFQLLVGPLVMPESPRWLQARHHQRSISHGLVLAIDAASSSAADLDTGSWYRLWRALRAGPARRPLLVGIGLQILQQNSGINVAVYYGPKIFTLLEFSSKESIVLSAAVCIAAMTATLVLSRVIDRFGRRPMSFLGLVLMALSLSCLGASFLLVSWQSAGWLALIAMVIYRMGFSMSLGPLPFIITAELFPGSFRASAVSLCWAVNWLSNFLVSLSFLPLLSLIGRSGAFFVYAGVCCAAILFVRYCVPETSGRRLEELETDCAAAQEGGAERGIDQ